MKRIQLVGLGLIVLSGVLSQFSNLKNVQWGVWLLAILALVGMVLVLYEWFQTWK